MYYHYMTAAEQNHLMRKVADMESAGRVEALRENRDHLERIVELLLEKETIDGEEIYALLGRPMPGERDLSLPVPAHLASPTDGPPKPRRAG